MNKIFTILLLVTTLLFSSQNIKKQKHILVLHSYHKTMNWVENIDKAIQNSLRPNQNNFVLHVEYMDTKRINSKEYILSLKDVYKLKYKDVKLDLILSSDNNAFEFLKQYRDEIFGNIPVSFSGVNNFKDDDLKGYENYTGAIEVLNAKDTIDTALELYSKTKKIFIINDYLPTGLAWQETIKEQLKHINLPIEYSKNTTIDELSKKIRSLDKDTIILFGVYFKDVQGKYITYEKMGKIITENSNSPVFCLLEFNITNNVVGGSVIGGYHQGYEQSLIAKKILNGEDPNNIPVKKAGTTKYVFNYPMLKKFNMNIHKLPKDSIIKNKPNFDHDKNKWITGIYTISVILLIVVIIILIRTQRKRDKTTKKKIEHKDMQLSQYKEALFIQSKAVMLFIEPDTGRILKANDAALDFYGYTLDELLNEYIYNINTLTKEEIDAEMKKAKIQKRDHFYFEHRLKDGSVKSVEVHSGPITIDGKNLLYSIIHDISEQKEQQKLFTEQSKLASMGEMIGNIAHQWRQPLSIISTGASGIKMQKKFGVLDDDDLMKTCDIINDNAQYLSQTIDDFRDFIKDERTKVIFNLKEYIDKLLHLIHGSVVNHNINIIVDVDSSIKLNGYPNELIQCFMNIYNNSKDAINSIKNIEDKYIFINATTNENSLIIDIKDNGGGIDAEILPKVFEPYFTTKHQSQGTGLGLHMTYNMVVEGMNGTISVQNLDFKYMGKNYKGANFKITLPLK